MATISTLPSFLNVTSQNALKRMPCLCVLRVNICFLGLEPPFMPGKFSLILQDSSKKHSARLYFQHSCSNVREVINLGKQPQQKHLLHEIVPNLVMLHVFNKKWLRTSYKRHTVH